MIENEKNANLSDPTTYAMKVKSRVTTTIDSDLVKIAKFNDWSFQELLEFGIKFKLAEKDSGEYPVCDLIKKFKSTIEKLQDTSQELYDLKESQKPKTLGKQLAEQEADEILKGELTTNGN